MGRWFAVARRAAPLTTIVTMGLIGFLAAGGGGTVDEANARGASSDSVRSKENIEGLPGAQVNTEAAIRDAKALLGAVSLPNGASRSGSSPSAALSGWGAPIKTPALVFRHRWWTVPGAPNAVLSYIEAHPPPGGTVYKGHSGSDRQRLVLSYRFPNIAGLLSNRRLTIVLAKTASGLTGVLADVQEVWIVPRPAADVIPATARVLELTVTRPEGSDLPAQGPPHPPETVLSSTVSEAGKVSAIVNAINRMLLVQPERGRCEVEGSSEQTVATLTFLASAGGPVLATARMPEFGCGLTLPAFELTLPAIGKTVELEGQGPIEALIEEVLGLSVFAREGMH